MYREYFIDWTCDYELVYYPFDTQVGTPLLPWTVTSAVCGVLQVCKMVFDMTGATRQYVDMEIDYDGVSCHKLCYSAVELGTKFEVLQSSRGRPLLGPSPC